MRNPLKKIEFYEVTEAGQEFLMTSAPQFISHEEKVYIPTAISRTQINMKAEMEKRNVDITVPITTPIAQRYSSNIVESHVYLTIFEREDGVTRVIYRGRLGSSSVDGGQLKMKFISATARLTRNGAHRRYSETCPYILYSTPCKAPKPAFTFNAEVLAVSGDVIRVKTDFELGEDAFKGGIFEAALNGIMRGILKNPLSTRVETPVIDPETNEQIDVIVHYETDLKLFSKFYALDVLSGDIVKISYGCNKQKETCALKFNNILNFGGFPYMADGNPFQGTII